MRNRSRSCGIGVAARRAATHRHTVRSETPSVSAVNRTLSLVRSPYWSSTANRSAAACRRARPAASTTQYSLSETHGPHRNPARHSHSNNVQYSITYSTVRRPESLTFL
jgi:hypothetical protein